MCVPIPSDINIFCVCQATHYKVTLFRSKMSWLQSQYAIHCVVHAGYECLVHRMLDKVTSAKINLC
jgi:hypothetical protein